MLLKDYYQILGLEPGATAKEIKQAYRQLAHQFHPDKPGNDSFAASRYLEIKEAYETLSHPFRKEAYLQQRWYAQSLGQKMAQASPDHPEVILNKALELNRYAATLNPYRIDRPQLRNYLAELLDTSTIQLLKDSGETAINEQIGLLLLEPVSLLEPEEAEDIVGRLLRIPEPGDKVRIRAGQVLSQVRHQHRKKYYEPVLLGVLTLLLCLLIYFFAR